MKKRITRKNLIFYSLLIFFFIIFLPFQPFVFDQKWHNISSNLAWFVTIPVALILLFHKDIRAKYANLCQCPSLIGKITLIPLTIFGVYIIIYSSSTQSAVGTWTKIFGTPYANIILLDKQETSQLTHCRLKSRYKLKNYYAIKSEQLKNISTFNKICIDSKTLKELKYPAILEVKGKESLFGLTVSDYTVSKEGISYLKYRELSQQTEEFWRN